MKKPHSKLTYSQLQSYEESGKSLEIYMKQMDTLVPLSKEEQTAILKEYIDGGRTDVALGHKLITSNQRLVAFICKKYANRKFHYIDLIQEGNIGMLEALEKFDFDKSNDASFAHFAHSYIFLRVSRYIEKNRFITHIGHNNDRVKVSYNLHKYADMEGDSGLTNVSKETIAKIAEDLDVSIKDVEFMIKFTADNNYVTSSVQNDEYGDNLDMLNSVYDENDDVEAKVLEDNINADRRKRIDTALAKLTPQEQTVIKERHLIDDDKPTLKDIGMKMGITGERVRQIEIKALNRMKLHFKYDEGGA